MKFKTKHKTVDALEVSYILDYAKSDWSKLPLWFKKKHAEDKVLIGYNTLQVETKEFTEKAGKDDVLIIDSNKDMFVMSKKEFGETYEDIVAP